MLERLRLNAGNIKVMVFERAEVKEEKFAFLPSQIQLAYYHQHLILIFPAFTLIAFITSAILLSLMEVSLM